MSPSDPPVAAPPPPSHFTLGPKAVEEMRLAIVACHRFLSDNPGENKLIHRCVAALKLAFDATMPDEDDPWLSQGGWVALDRIDKLVQQLRADFGCERDRNQALETELAALRTSRVAAPTPKGLVERQFERAAEDVKALPDWLRRPRVAAPTPETPSQLPKPQPPRFAVDLAIEVSGWSPCRSKRGVVIFRRADIVTHGYNYKPRGFECDGSEACKATCGREAVHAEQQALLSAGPHVSGTEMLHVKTVDGVLVPSGGPSCVECSKLAIAAGIAAVWLYHADGWRRYEMHDFHAQSLLAGAVSHPQPDPRTTKDDEVARGDRRGSSVGFGTAGSDAGAQNDSAEGRNTGNA